MVQIIVLISVQISLSDVENIPFTVVFTLAKEDYPDGVSGLLLTKTSKSNGSTNSEATSTLPTARVRSRPMLKIP